MSYPRLWARVYNAPLLIHPDKARVIEEVFRGHLNGDQAAPRVFAMEDESLTPEQQAQLEHERRCRAYTGLEIVRADDKPYALTRSGVALIPLLGTLVQRGSWLDSMSGLTSYDMVASMLDKALNDPQVRGIMLEIDSPGGEAAGLIELSDRVFAARDRKPTWAVANEQAYSAAYWLAASAGRVYTPITGGVGSIGAVMLHVDQSKRDAMMGLKYTFIFAGEHKVDGNSHQPLDNGTLTWAQAEVDRTRQLFAQSVATRRGLSTDAVLATEAGLLTPPQALEGGFIDGAATLVEAVTLLEEQLRQPGSTGTRTAAGRTQSTTSQEIMMNPQLSAAAAAILAALSIKPETLQAASIQALETQCARLAADARGEGEKAGEEKGHAAGRADAIKAERERSGAILGCDEAKGRTGLALHLALQTDTDLDAAKKLLAAAPKQAASDFAAAMAQVPNPRVGADGDLTLEAPRKTASAQSIYAAREQARAAAK